MTATFSTNFPPTKPIFKNEPTRFVEKIIAGLHVAELATKGALVQPFRNDKNYQPLPNAMYCDTLPKIWEGLRPKIHMIRKYKKLRWREGMPIHFKIWKGKPYNSKTFNFAPLIPCSGVQKISIQYHHLQNQKQSKVVIKVDGVTLGFEDSKALAWNDGFESLQQFLCWFDEDFEGYIIHWTNIRYGTGKNIEVVEPRTVRPLEFVEVNKEDLKVLKSTIQEVKMAENELLTEVIKNHLGRPPDDKDVSNFSKSITRNSPGKYEYELWFNSEQLGTVTSKTTKAGGIEFTFKSK